MVVVPGARRIVTVASTEVASTEVANCDFVVFTRRCNDVRCIQYLARATSMFPDFKGDDNTDFHG